MEIHQNVSLAELTTMHLGGPAREVLTITTLDDLRAAYSRAATEQLPVFVLGGGSNVVGRDEGFDGLILLIKFPGFTVTDVDKNTTVIKIGAGEDWDNVVRRTVELGLHGIETLSAIPGTAGGAPVQNIGAYGQEIADTLTSLEAYDTRTGDIVRLTAADCEFGYRDSIFRGREQGRYVITSITLRLTHDSPTPPFYKDVQHYFDEHGTTSYTVQTLRDAVLAIRADKLPDPAERPSAGSFFKNAFVSPEQLAQLVLVDPTLPHYEQPDGTSKIPSGRLIELAGFKGQLLHGMRVHDRNALVLINESATRYADLAAARSEIVASVQAKFGVTLVQEPLEVQLAN